MKLLKNYKEKNNIDKEENELRLFNSKTCQYEKFKKYIEKKNKVNAELFEKYENVIFRRYKWYGYINRQKAEAELIDSIKNKFGKDVTIIYGDWSQGKQMRNMLSTPNLGLKRKLNEHFKVYNIDEYRTSCLYYGTHEKCENLYLPTKTGETRKMHSILTYEMENKRKGCIDRDDNSVNNMITIVEQYLKDKSRPKCFSRKKEMKDNAPSKTIKDINLEMFRIVIVV